jgi:hypothetical protein
MHPIQRAPHLMWHLIMASDVASDCTRLSECSASVPGRIRWYQSRLRTEENDLVTLPNSLLAEKQVIATDCLCLPLNASDFI